MRLYRFGLVLALATFVAAYPVVESLELMEDSILDELDDACEAPVSEESASQTAATKHHHHSLHHHSTFTTSPSIISTPSISSADSTISSSASPTTSQSVTPTVTTDPPTSTATDPATTSSSSSTASDPPDPSASISTGSTTTSSASPTTTASIQGTLHGVNIGNWLIIEPWMDDGTLLTGIFNDAPDQWTFDSLDTDGSAIKAHWNTWFTEADVQKLQGYGFNALRIPIGYWAINNDNTPFHQGAADYMDQAIVWARNAGMKVMIDCHGSPGSQNGQMHSGHQGAVLWQQGDNLNTSTQILQQMVQRWATIDNADTVFAIEIVNEPTANAPNSFSVSQSWAADTYTAIQGTIAESGLNKNIQIVTHDSFQGITKFIPYADELVSPINAPTFGVDQHDYQLYTDSDNALDQPGHIQKACGWASDLAITKASMPVYVGEWSALTNICVDSNGVTSSFNAGQAGSCTTADSSAWSPQLIEQVRRYVEAQLDVYEANSDGHFIWSFKGPGGWGLYNLINVGVWPQPITDRKYPGQCS